MSKEKLLINDPKSNNSEVMSNKQIEEMACDMCTVIQNCNEPHKPIPSCQAYQYAKKAVEKGYHKQSVGENISQMHPSDEFICEKCGLIIRECCRYEIDEDDGDEICYEFPYKFCPRCGMKVKGGAE